MEYPELKETKSSELPPASLDLLKKMREDACSQSLSRDFKLQNYQRFLRRILSPDSPTRCLLMVHGTGTGKTCSAIQIAEEYIIRPEFQNRRVLVLAQPAVQSNFRTQIFDINRVSVDASGLLLSKQCTGRRYLEMLERIQEPMKWTDKAVRQRMDTTVQSIISEFYKFQGYTEFGNSVDRERKISDAHLDSWIHKTFDNRLIIVDEAHSLRDTETETAKFVSRELQRVIQTANNVTLILLTATPMYHSYDEILYYFDLFLWNDKRQKPDESVQNKFFKNGEFIEGAEDKFRSLCQEYISFIKGDNPLTFPFRLPPPDISPPDRKRDIKNRYIPPEEQRNLLALTASYVKGIQADVLSKMTSIRGFTPTEAICVLPENKPFHEVFSFNETFSYKGTKFLAPSQVENYSSKFSYITKLIPNSEGIIFVYSNLNEYGARMFAMCLEEHGYESVSGKQLLTTTSEEIPRGSMGKYILLATDASQSEIVRELQRIRRPSNRNGDEVKIIVGSQKIAEGVDLKFIRQVHVLNPWYNMSRIEQVIGRGIRTCSHQLLPFEQQNCTVYLHVCRLPDSNRELIDECIYRTYTEPAAKKISMVKKVIMESAMDCELQHSVNNMPSSWKELDVPQIRSQDGKEVSIKLKDMSAFGSEVDTVCKISENAGDPFHERPLSAYTDVRDELFDKFISMFYRKPIWLKDDIIDELNTYDSNVVIYMLQNAIETGLKLKNKNGTIGHLESKNKYYTFTSSSTVTLQDRLMNVDEKKSIKLVKHEKKQKETETSIDEIRESYKWVAEFPNEILDWYIADHVFTKEEKIKYLLKTDKAIRIGDIQILGSNEFYKNGEKVTLIGKDADEYSKWLESRKKAFLDNKGYFATVEDGRLKFNLDNKADTLQVAERSKIIGGRSCISFPLHLMNLFVEWLGNPFPNQVNTGVKRCQYISLLIRDAILKKRDGIIWWTPEEWEIFNEDANRKDLVSRLK
jgi:superfamily II DNA or RNA helicase